jgi:uncharacterized protein
MSSDAPSSQWGPEVRVGTGSRQERVTTVVSRRVKPGKESEFERWAHGIIMAASYFPGHLSASVLHDPDSHDYHVLFQFTDQARMDAWMGSDERDRWLAKVGGLMQEEQALQQTTGLETWFRLPTSNVPTMKPPPRWKMWAVSLVAIYPLVLLFLAFVAPHVTRWPLPARAALFPFVLLTLMTYVIMPIVTRIARRWLRP